MLSHRLTSLLSQNARGKLRFHTPVCVNNLKCAFTFTVRRDLYSKATPLSLKQAVILFFKRPSSSDASRVRRVLNAGTSNRKEKGDIKLFSNDTMDWKMKLASFGGVYMALLIVQSTDIVYKFLSMSKPTEGENTNYPWYYWWKYFNFHSEAWKITACIGIIMSGICILAFSTFYPSRVVREVTILRGGQTLRFNTCKSFGRTSTFDVPVKNVSAVMSLEDVFNSTKETYPLTIKGKKLFYQFHVKKGVIHNRKLFEDFLVRPRIFDSK